MYGMAVEAWASHPGVSLREAQRAVGRPDNGVPLDPELARSIRDLESPEAALNRLNGLREEVEQLNPHYRAPWRTSIDIHDGHRH